MKKAKMTSNKKEIVGLKKSLKSLKEKKIDMYEAIFGGDTCGYAVTGEMTESGESSGYDKGHNTFLKA